MEKTVSWFMKFGILSIEQKSGQWLMSLHYKEPTGVLGGTVHSWGDDFNYAIRELARKTLSFHQMKTKQKEEQDRLLELFSDDDVK